MELSIFLAKLLGIYSLIVGVDLLLRRHELAGAVKDFASSKGLLVLSGSLIFHRSCDRDCSPRL